MKKTILFMAAIILTLGIWSSSVMADGLCTTIQDGTLLTSDGDVIETGYDMWGYNYQALIFNGTYCDAYRDAAWCQPYADVELLMKWNDAWLSNRDCDMDGLLDRHYSFDSYKGSGAWLTNHQAGKVEVNGKLRKWTYFIKIVAVEGTDVLQDGYFYRDGVEIGPAIWGDFAIVEEVSNDPSAGQHGIQYKSPLGPGFGIYGDNP
jgi:hypothetical protein